MRGETRERLPSKRVAVVDDVINAGSAVRATIRDIRKGGAEVVGIGALLLLGSPAHEYADEQHLPLVYAGSLPNQIWTPDDCLMCAAGLPLEVPFGQ